MNRNSNETRLYERQETQNREEQKLVNVFASDVEEFFGFVHDAVHQFPERHRCDCFSGVDLLDRTSVVQKERKEKK